MKITSLRIRVCEPKQWQFQWRDDIPPIHNTMTVFEIGTAEGHTGVCTSWLPASPVEIAEQANHFFRPLIVGADSNDRERLWHEMMAHARYLIMPKAASHIDIALWDLAGKQAGLPVYKLLGAYRDKVPTYATTTSYDTVEKNVEVALAIKKRGYNACKLHPPSIPDLDIEICKAVREAVGPDYRLMLDPTSAYEYDQALRVGRAIEALGFYWYEDPIRDDDIAGLRELCRALDIMVLMGESTHRGPWAFANFFNAFAGDGYRAVADVVGGLTGLRKVAAAAEVHNRRVEPHSYGSTLVQAAHLHHILASRNCEYFEVPHPKETLDFGMKNAIEIDADGHVHAPTAPGLGFEIDWDVIENSTIAEFR